MPAHTPAFSTKNERTAAKRLIAAAPALLEALERVINEANCNPGSCGSCDQARAAIALAKGETV